MAAISRSLERTSNRWMCTNSCSSTYRSAVSCVQSVFFGIRMTGRRTPKVSGEEIRPDRRMAMVRRSGCDCSQRRVTSLSTGKDARNSRQQRPYAAANTTAQTATPTAQTIVQTGACAAGAEAVCCAAAAAAVSAATGRSGRAGTAVHSAAAGTRRASRE